MDHLVRVKCLADRIKCALFTQLSRGSSTSICDGKNVTMANDDFSGQFWSDFVELGENERKAAANEKLEMQTNCEINLSNDFGHFKCLSMVQASGLFEAEFSFYNK
ncbi:conserved hypothetical protein [Trichinella spiralis]|uniref:hypothetical protein n=1 Tax=Trichinella spiralis TaxID=6334 RepID=UPI0001EFE1A9|nr:conserved hypothetical protein [Trichinella spiralis]